MFNESVHLESVLTSIFQTILPGVVAVPFELAGFETFVKASMCWINTKETYSQFFYHNKYVKGN